MRVLIVEDELPIEVALLDRLRSSAEWLPARSLVAERDGELFGHVVCSRAFVGEHPVLALGPLSVLTSQQRTGLGSALMHAVPGAADASRADVRGAFRFAPSLPSRSESIGAYLHAPAIGAELQL